MNIRAIARWTGTFGVAFLIALLPAATRAAGAEGSSPPLASVIDEAPVCRIDDPEGRSTRVDTGAQIAQIRALIAADAAAAGGSDSDGGPVVLNNRGYNYDARTVVDPALLQFEAQRLGR